jgi:hypothetical protein
MAHYFQKAQHMSHILASAAEPLKDSELISYILVGLSAEYDSLVTSITTRMEPITLEDLYSHLLTYEQCLEHHHSIPHPLLNPSFDFVLYECCPMSAQLLW